MWLLKPAIWLVSKLFGGPSDRADKRKDFRAINAAYEKLAEDFRNESQACQEREKQFKRVVRKKMRSMRAEFAASQKIDRERIAALEKEVVRLQTQADDDRG